MEMEGKSGIGRQALSFSGLLGPELLVNFVCNAVNSVDTSGQKYSIFMKQETTPGQRIHKIPLFLIRLWKLRIFLRRLNQQSRENDRTSMHGDKLVM